MADEKSSDLESRIQSNESALQRFRNSAMGKTMEGFSRGRVRDKETELTSNDNERKSVITEINGYITKSSILSKDLPDSFYSTFDELLDMSFLGSCNLQQLKGINSVVRSLMMMGRSINRLVSDIDPADRAKYEKWLMYDEKDMATLLTEKERQELNAFIDKKQEHEDLLKQYDKALEFSHDAMQKSQGVFQTLSDMNRFDVQKMNDVIGHLDSGDLHTHRIAAPGKYTGEAIFEYPSEKDLQIVSAMKTFGVDLSLTYSQDNGYKWSYKGQNDHHLLSGENAKFNQHDIQALLDNTLNKPITARLKDYSVKGMLATFAESAGVVDKKGVFPERLEVQISALLDDNIMMLRGQKQALMEYYKAGATEVYKNIEPAADGLDISETFEEDAQRALLIADDSSKGLLTSLKDRLMKRNSTSEPVWDPRGVMSSLMDLNKAVRSTKQNIDNKFTTLDSFTPYTYEALYTQCIAEMEGQNKPEIAKLLQEKRDQYIANVEYQKHLLKENVGKMGLTLDNVISDMSAKMLSNGGMKLENGTWKLGVNDVPEDLAEIIKKRIEQKASAQVNNTQEQESVMQSSNRILGASASTHTSKVSTVNVPAFDSKMRPGIFAYYAAQMGEFADQDKEPEDKKLGSEFCEVMREKTVYDIAIRLFQKDNYLDKRVHELVDGANGISLDKAFKKIQDEVVLSADKSNFMFPSEMLKQAYITANPTSDYAKNNPDVVAGINDREDVFKKHLLLLDMASDPSLWTEEEYNKYYDPNTPESVKHALIAEKMMSAREAYRNLKPEQARKRMDEAAKLHKDNAQTFALSLGEYDKSLSTYEAENGLNGKPLTSLVKQFMDSAKAGAMNVAGQVAPQLVPSNEPEKQQENADEKVVTFGDLYPSGPNLAKFQKKMKPFCGKELMKHFFDPLLEAVAKIRINMNANKGKDTPLAKTQSPKEGTDVDLSTAPTDTARDATDPSAVNANKANTQQHQVQIGQREFEASVFMPASIMMKKLCEGKDENDPMYESLRAVSSTFDLLSTVDENPNNPLCVKNSDGKDLRDDLRRIMFEVSEGRKLNDPNWLKQELANTIGGYPVGKDAPELQTLMTAFEKINPIAMKILLNPTSEAGIENGKQVVKVGSKLPVDELSKCQNDKERMAVVEKFVAPDLTRGDSSPLVVLEGILESGMDESQKKVIQDTTFEVQDVTKMMGAKIPVMTKEQVVSSAIQMLGNVSEQEKSALIDLARSQYAKSFEDTVKTGNVEQLKHMLNSIMPAEVVSEEEYDDENLPI